MSGGIISCRGETGRAASRMAPGVLRAVDTMVDGAVVSAGQTRHRFRYGIEHESALLRPDGRFADFTNTEFEEMQAIVDALPRNESDYPSLRVGDAGIKVKRWYVEGFERFAPDGRLLRCDPKGIELRTTIHDSIEAALAALKADHELFAARAAERRFQPVAIGHNPVQPGYRIEPDLNEWERAHRMSSPEDRTAYLHMTTYGPDLNLSWVRCDEEQAVDAAAKLTYYSPCLIPLSFSSPFFGGERWDGLSVRTHVRTGLRPAALAFVRNPALLVDSDPSLTQPARIDAEAGRVEFKAFDVCPDLDLYGDLLSLLAGLLLDDTLPGRRTTPDADLHRRSARLGFDDPEIREGAEEALRAAQAALPEAADRARVARLRDRLEARTCPAKGMIARYEAGEPVAGLCRTSRGRGPAT